MLISLIITLVLMAPAQTPTPTPSALEAQVKQELTEAALAYREGDFAGAQAHSEKALQLDPQNKTAVYFVARTIHAQYKPGVSTPENVAKAREAIFAYLRILERFPDDDEAYKAVAYLHGALKEEELLRQWVQQRAENVSIPAEKRAEAYVVLASKDWDCSYKITEQPGAKIATVDGRKMDIRYQMPKERGEFEQATQCANRALEFANMAITLKPENAPAWSYKTNILLELEKLAEMSGELQQKADLHRQYEVALRETNRLSENLKPKY